MPKEVTRWSSSVQTACDVMGMWLHRVGIKIGESGSAFGACIQASQRLLAIWSLYTSKSVSIVLGVFGKIRRGHKCWGA